MQQELSRKLAAIMFTDIFSFTSLMEKDEADAMEKKSVYKEVLHQFHKQYNGEIIKEMGDGSLSVFTNSVDAVWCAIEIQKALRAPIHIPVRIGIHTGNVLFQHGDVMGDAVNIASRMESFAAPGSVFISGKVYDEIKNQKNIEVVLMGKFELKNVSVPMEIFAVSNDNLVVPKKRALHGKGIQFSKNKFSSKTVMISTAIVFSVLLGSLFFFKKYMAQRMNDPQSKTIAVIPFANLSVLKDDEYFSDGICNEIQTQLSKIGALSVISRTSMLQFKDTKKTMKEIGEAIGADVLLEGSVQKSNDKVHINMQLIDARNDKQLWAETYDKDFKDIFSIQSDIAKNVAMQLKANLTSSEKTGIEKRPTKNLEAYNLYLKGNYLIQKVTPDDLANGLKMLNEAIKLDPTFALPYLGIAYYYGVATDFYMAPPEALPQLKMAAQTAIEMDSTLADGYAYLGAYDFWYAWNLPKAEEEFKKAVALSSKEYFVHWIYNVFLAATGNTVEGKQIGAKLTELDPMSADAHAWYGSDFYFARQYDEALSHLDKSYALDANYPFAAYFKGMCYIAQGKFSEAIKQEQLAHAIFASPWSHGRLAYAYARAGNTQMARAILDSLRLQSDTAYVASDVVASVYVALGDKEHAFEYLDKATNERAGWLVYLNVDPIWDPIRNDARFIAILKKMGLK
ncbi:MAG: adenylate/guanylate cyclase domain-containing protein [Saprospiraceae bacterium]